MNHSGNHSSALGLVLLAACISAMLALPAFLTRPGPAAAQAATPPGMSCNDIFVDDFPLNDPKVTGDFAQITVGPEPYTYGYYPEPRNGVRIRNFQDPLRVADRPGGDNYGDVWSVDDTPADGFRVIGADDGMHVGGTAQFDGGTPHVNHAGVSHGLPTSQQNPTYAYFQVTYRERVDASANLGNIENGNGGMGIFGILAVPGHVGNWGYFRSEFGNTPAQARIKLVDGVWSQLLFNDLWPQQPVVGQMYDWKVVTSMTGIYAEYGGNPKNYTGFQRSMSQLNSVGLGGTARYRGMVLRLTFSDFKLDWLNRGRVSSIGIPLPAGYTLYGNFSARQELNNNSIVYEVVDAGGRRVPIDPAGTDLGTIAPPLMAPIHLEAILDRPSFDDESPVLLEWRVAACKLATPTPTATATQATYTPTPTNTPRPTSTPRPTNTPGAFFQVAPLKPAIHLKVDPILDPPASPDDQSDWRESDAVYYPLQVYAGLVPFAYADPGRPPQLCYWNGSRWACVNGTIQLRSYVLHGIVMNGIDYLNEKIEVPYARTHYYQRWNVWQYRYDPGEYTYVNWLAPDGVVPQCPYTMRCVNLLDASAGNYQIIYDVIGNIHWDAIPGIGGPLDVGFTDTFEVHLAIAVPRAEP